MDLVVPLARQILLLLLVWPAITLAQPPPPGALIDVEGRRLHLYCVGKGTPTVVVDGGAGGWSIFYRSIQSRIAEATRVCTYDRAGLGWSEESPAPRTSARMAAQLHALLNGSDEAPPYVLVGHSLGAWNVRLFAEHHPDLVAGVVLAEAAHEEQWERLPPEARGLLVTAAELYRTAAQAARGGTLAPGSVPPAPFSDDGDLRAAYETEMSQPETYETMAAEVEASMESAAEVAAIGDLDAIPLAVVTARNSFAAFEGTGIPIDAANAAWAEMQEELTALSTNSRWFLSRRGDHRIHETDPDLLVEAILDVVMRVRASRLRVLPPRSVPEIDALLAGLERAYASMDVEGFVSFFDEDFEQVDVTRRVHVQGRDAWRRQTERINAAHLEMGRSHHGRALIGDWVVVEVEWWGIVRGETVGAPGVERSYRYSGLGLLQVDHGVIRRQILYSDGRTLAEQLGVPLP